MFQFLLEMEIVYMPLYKIRIGLMADAIPKKMSNVKCDIKIMQPLEMRLFL